MFLDLFWLYKKNGYSNRSPLEDFNTEVFAGILRLSEPILKDFIELINLPVDSYEVKTQLHRSLDDRSDCIIDLVLIGDNNVCFVENKVNSGEGWEQLDRYCEALNVHYKNHRKHLVYCTKFTDHKTETRHNFKQIRWYQIADILRNYNEDDTYLSDYLQFLKHHNMSQKNTFSPEMIIAMENIKEVSETMKIHVENSRPYFENIFNLKKSDFQEGIIDRRDRIASYITNILPGHSAHTELLFCIKSSLVKLQTQIFINKSHPKIDEVKKAIKSYITENNSLKLGYRAHPDGFVIFMDRKIYDLINDSETDDKIKNWFIDSFYEFSKFFKATPELGWIPALVERDLFYEYEEFLRADNYRPSTVNIYSVLAKQVMRAGYAEEEWRALELYSLNKEILKKFRSLTVGDHMQEFKGKTSFRRFLDKKIQQQESIVTSN
ncbi:PD-(D/E)XK nuclease family protein [Salegentibacter agarivorans]